MLDRGEGAGMIVLGAIGSMIIVGILQAVSCNVTKSSFYYEHALLSELSEKAPLYQDEHFNSSSQEGLTTAQRMKLFIKSGGNLGAVISAVEQEKKTKSKKEEQLKFNMWVEQKGMLDLVRFLTESNNWAVFAADEKSMSQLLAILTKKSWIPNPKPDLLFGFWDIVLLVQFGAFLVLLLSTKGNPWERIPHCTFKGYDWVSYTAIGLTIPGSAPLMLIFGIFWIRDWIKENKENTNDRKRSSHSDNFRLGDELVHSKKLLEELQGKLTVGRGA